MSGELVSIIAVCYNHSAYVAEALDAILAQDYPNLEVIVTDDRSPDDSDGAIRAWLAANDHPDHFTYRPNQQNKGLCATLNATVPLTRGTYVQVIACDDVMTPDKISRQVARFAECGPDTALVCSNFDYVDEHGNYLRTEFPEGFSFPQQDVFSHILRGYRGHYRLVHSPTVLMRRSALVAAGPYDETIVQEDLDMWLRITRRHRVAYVDAVLVKYRVLSSSLSNSITVRPALVRDRVYVVAKFLAEETDPARRESLIFRQRKLLRALVNMEPGHDRAHKLLRRVAVDRLPTPRLAALTGADQLNELLTNLPARVRPDAALFREVSAPLVRRVKSLFG